MKKLLKVLSLVIVVCFVFTSVFAMDTIGAYDYDDYTSSIDLSDDASAGVAAVLGAMMGAMAGAMVFACIVAIYMIVVMWKIFVKAGKPGWAALIPIYNTVVLFQICGLSPWLLLLALVPVVGYIAIAIIAIISIFRLAKSFGKSVGFGFGMLFLSIIFYSILAFDSSTYLGPNGQA